MDFTKRIYFFAFNEPWSERHLIPSGGLKDVKEVFDTIEDANKAIAEAKENGLLQYDILYCFDRLTGEIINIK